jgi:hypothetical protein
MPAADMAVSRPISSRARGIACGNRGLATDEPHPRDRLVADCCVFITGSQKFA